MTVEIYQLRLGEEDILRGLAFRGYEDATDEFGEDAVKKSNYDMVFQSDDYEIVRRDYAGKGVYGILEDIYCSFNTERPEGFTGHSLSVSDVVRVFGKYYYCDSFGWKELDWE